MVRGVENNTNRMECDGTVTQLVDEFGARTEHQLNLPNDSFVLMLSNVGSYFAINLAGTQCHCKRLCHVVLNSLGNFVVPVGWSNPNFG